MGGPSSAVEITDKRHRLDRENGSHTPDSDASDDYRRCHSPSYDSYDRGRYRRQSKSPEHRSPGHNNGTLNDNALPKKFGRGDYRRNGAYLYSDRGNGRRSDSESDEELMGLSFEDYRRLKRQKTRKMLKHCIWNVTPSPPRDEKEDLQDKAEEISEKYGDDGIRNSDSSDKETKTKVQSKPDSKSVSQKSRSSESESSSESDDSRSRKKRTKSSASKRRSRKSYSDSESEESENESESEEDSKERKKLVKSRRTSSKRKRNQRKRKYGNSDESEESGSECSSSDDRVIVLQRVGASMRKRTTQTESDSSYFEESLGAEADAMSKSKADEVKKTEMNAEALKFKELIESQKKPILDNEPTVGPMSLPRADGHISYGGALGLEKVMPLHSMFNKGSVSPVEVKWVFLLRKSRSLKSLDM